MSRVIKSNKFKSPESYHTVCFMAENQSSDSTRHSGYYWLSRVPNSFHQFKNYWLTLLAAYPAKWFRAPSSVLTLISFNNSSSSSVSSSTLVKYLVSEIILFRYRILVLRWPLNSCIIVQHDVYIFDNNQSPACNKFNDMYIKLIKTLKSCT